MKHEMFPPMLFMIDQKWKVLKNMITLVVWIWQYQEPETDKYRKSRRQK